jgi:hypothetical protein
MPRRWVDQFQQTLAVEKIPELGPEERVLPRLLRFYTLRGLIYPSSG